MPKSKSKSKRVVVGLVSPKTGHRRITRKNTVNTPDPLVRNKYDPIAREVVAYKEVKKNLGRNEVRPRKK